ncbi:NACHT and WD repeat domain-containing protein, partial [Scytonema sp. PCC 10023]|uniref:NACHT and WD repeat domain-containing protein n=1 Tax=Scytonema sp. PCC 10023 TaxID=1680591 RepID=UPI0039C69C1E
MNNDSEANVNIRRDVQGVSAYTISGGTITQYFISANEAEESIHRRPLIQVSPYLGLSKFETADKDKFFGREKWITQLGDRLLKENNVLLLLGASGSGKSSLIRAGLIPHLRDNWGSFLNLTFRPDKNPFESLYYCLAPHYTQLQAEIARTVAENTLIQVSQSLKQDSRWLIFVDQFEELFTTTPKSERDKFVASLVQLINQEDSSVKIVLTMRADFLDKFSSYSELGHIHDRYGYILTNMSEKELQLAIAEPAARNGVTFEKGLVDQIIKDFDEQSGSLPLLEYTLDLLWEEEKRKDNLTERVLKTKTYEQLGGVSGALNQQANKIYNKELNEQEREAAKEIFLELVGIVEKQPVSRRTDKSQFLASRDKESVLNKLIENRLLVSTGEKQIATVEVAHEQLLRSWQVLTDLIKDKEDIIVFRSRLTTDANQWNEIRKQDEQKANDELWSGLKLEQVLKYRKDPKFHQILFAKPESLENQFIEVSIARRDFLRQQEEERKQRELETAQKVAQEAEARREAEAQARQAAEQRAEESEKRLNAEAEARKQAEQKRKQLTYGLVIVSALVVAAGFGLWQTEEQRKQAIDALLTSSQELFASGKEIDARIVGISAGKQIKQAAFWVNLDSQRTKAISTLLQQAVYGVREYNRLEKHTDKVFSVSYSPDGKTLASASADNTIKLWDVATGEERTADMGHNDSVYSVAFSSDGKTLASASADNTIKLWNVATGKEKTTLNGHSNAVISVSYSPDGKTLASASRDNTIKLWDAATGKEKTTLNGHSNAVIS